MIGRSQNTSSALLLRDAARSSRRWQTYAMRTLFSASLLALVLGVILGMTELAQRFDPADLGWAGRGMFVAFAVVQVLLAALFAPFAVARAVIEERDQHTIDLLMLTRLRAPQILRAKVTARLLVLVTVLLGALPVLGLVVSLGGVSVVEIVAVTVHALVAVAVLGVLGGFFAIFTRSPVIATLTALTYGLIAFLAMPLVYVTLTGDWRGMSLLSPLFGTTARSWWALLPAVSYAPVVAMTLVLGARFYELRASNARLRRFFEGAAWSTGKAAIGGLLVGVGMVTVLPFGSVGAWVFTVRGSQAASSMAWWEHLLSAASRGTVWLWCVGLLLIGTWLYLRVAMDMVLLADDLVRPSGRRKRSGKVKVWGNPVAWREMRGKTWKVMGPAIGVWLLVLLAIFQTGVWVIPGGMLGVGAINAGAALVMTVWLAVGAIERERNTGSLEILLTSTMGSFPILFGKVAGVALPTFVLLLLSVPLFVLGAPHMQLYWVADQGASSLLTAVVKGILGSFWVGALWLATLTGSMTLALGMKHPRTAYPAAMAGVGVFLVAPALVALVARDLPLVAAPARLLVPVLVVRPTFWEIGLSTLGLTVVAGVLFAIGCGKLRTWGLMR